VSAEAGLTPLDVKYELIYTKDETRTKSVKSDLSPKDYGKMRQHAAVSKSPLSTRVKTPVSVLAPKPVQHKANWFTLAQVADLKAADQKPKEQTQRSRSQSTLAEQLKTARKQRGAAKNVQVVSLYELVS
jgi:hypothetical protein